MNRLRAAALTLSLAILAGVAFAVPARAADEHTFVTNQTGTPVWVTQYADVGAFGWADNHFCRPGMVHPGSRWTCLRGSKDKNGPWRLRMEVDKNGRHYDLITNYWYDGHQHNFNVAGDPNSRFYICEDAKGFFWSYSHNCATHN